MVKMNPPPPLGQGISEWGVGLNAVAVVIGIHQTVYGRRYQVGRHQIATVLLAVVVVIVGQGCQRNYQPGSSVIAVIDIISPGCSPHRHCPSCCRSSSSSS